MKRSGNTLFGFSGEKRLAASFQDLVEMERIKNLLEALHKVIQVPIGLVSPSSEVLAAVGWQSVCSAFHRVHPVSRQCCIESNNEIQSRLQEGEIASAKCSNGLWDMAMPIMADSRHLATLFIGQFLFDDEEIDIPFFKAQALRYAYDEEAYFQAIEAVPRISRQSVRHIIDYTTDLVALLAELGMKNHALAHEVTERRLAEYALGESEKQYRALVENVPGLVYLCLNDDAYTTIFVSDAVESLLGFSAHTMINEATSLSSLIHAEDRTQAQEQVGRCIARREPYVLNYRMLHKDGGYRWVEERGQGIWDETDMLRFLQGVIFDISERKRVEDQRQKTEANTAKAQRLESLGILAGGVAHDFNNLLVSILGHADLVSREVCEETPAYDSVSAILESARRAAGLTRQMLAYSGKGHFQIRPINVSSLMKENERLLREHIGDACTLDYQLDPDVPDIGVDVEQVKQLLINIVVNAAESYDQRSGDIVLSSGVRHCDAAFLEATYHNEQYAEGDYVYIGIRDHGCGMTAETMRQLCDPFFSTKFTGRGLGMAAVLGILRGHHGSLAVESRLNFGTTIQALFPVYKDQDKLRDAVNQSARSPQESTGRILIIDDEQIILNVAQKMMERAGFRVLTAQNGYDALAVMNKNDNAIDCIILDLTMPKLASSETLKRIRKIAPDVPVIISSGYDQDEVISRMGNLKYTAFLSKPYKMETLIQLLRDIV